jgi:hypothetical protein
MIKVSGNILKMTSKLTDPVQYELPIGDESLPMNQFIGKKISLKFDGVINCIHSGKKIKKSYGQGYSFESFMKLASCDMCILKPELCHFDKGTCREPEWGKKNCFAPHYVYLSVSSHLKVGITRETQIPTRWIDQGASYALPLMIVPDRKTSGLIENVFREVLSDKTNWRKMLKNEVDDIDLYAERDRIFEEFEYIFDEYEIDELDEDIVEVNFPVLEYPTKVKSVGFDKQPLVEGTLMGIKGQYLIFDNCVINMRKHQGYNISLTCSE